MKKYIARLAVLLAVVMPVAAQAVDPYYVTIYSKKDGVTTTDSGFVSGSRGFVPYNTTTTYTCDTEKTPEGYYPSHWWLGQNNVFDPAAKAYTEKDGESLYVAYTDAIYDKLKTRLLALVVTLSQKQYTFTYNPGEGGSWKSGQEPKGATVAYWTTNTVASADCVQREGHTFKNWLCSTGKTLEGGEEFTGSTLGIQANGDKVTLTAQWAVSTYSVTLHKNGGTCEDLTEYTYGEGAMLPIPEKKGYTFNGWYKTSSFSGNPVEKILTTDKGDKEFWAKFTANKYDIEYANCEKPEPFYTDRATFDKSFKVSKPKPKSSGGGAAFAGWQVASGLDTSTAWYSEDGGEHWKRLESDMTKVGAGVEFTCFSNLTAEVDGEVRLYANWGTQYTITTVAQPTEGGTVSGDGQYESGAKVDLVAKPNDGYSFEKWTDDPSALASRQITVTKSETYTANFTGNVYKVYFEDEIGERTYKRDKTHGQPFGELPTPDPEPGMTFDGWYDDDGTGERITSDSIVKVTENKYSFYAHWGTVTYYYVAFDGNGATGGTPMEPQKMNVGEATALNPNTYEWEGHNFAGWTNSVGTAYANGQVVTDLAAPGQTNTLYAVWTPWKNYVDFKADGGEGEMEQQTFEYGVTNALSANQFAKAGYAFQGWTNEAAQAFYVDRQEVAFCEPDNTTNTLKAVWTVNTYTMQFTTNATSVLNPGAQSDIPDCASGKGVTLPKCQYINLPSCGFDGWVDENSVTNRAGTTVTNYVSQSGETLTYKAAWKDSGPLSPYVGLTGIAALTNLNEQAYYRWKGLDTGGAQGGPCIRYEVSFGDYDCSMAMLVNGPGTLKFRYKSDVGDDDSFELYIDGKYMGGFAEKSYTEVEEKISTGGIHAIKWRCYREVSGDSGYNYIDKVTWTPEGGKPKPLILFIK